MPQETLRKPFSFVINRLSNRGEKARTLRPLHRKSCEFVVEKQSQFRQSCGWAAVFFVFGLAGGGQAAPIPELAQVIVKFKDETAALPRQVSSAQQPLQAQTSQALGKQAGLKLTSARALAERTKVVTALGMSSQALADQLALDSNVEYAVPNQRRYAHAAPNDPLYADGFAGEKGPVSGQWYLREPQGEVQSAINAEGAWALLSNNNANVVVAVLDGGVRFDHPELHPVSKGGNVLPGYDMVTQVNRANDGDERDLDAQDPGDWVSAQDLGPGGSLEGKTCTIENSTWHGTRTASLVGAPSNNGIGMAGVGRNVQVLPVRVLGKCGGMDSDIIMGMRWAAGLSVPGVPDNPNPARIINLSLGSVGSCPKPYVDVLQELAAAGALVVMSAGNSAGGSVDSPANCPGALAVGGLQHTGAKAGFSGLGPEVAISAPAGNCDTGIAGVPCKYPIVTATNAGETTPIADDASYTNGENYSVGTSFSAPLVAGTAALMLSVNPNLAPAQLRQLLMSSARTFPSTGAVTDLPRDQVNQCLPVELNESGSVMPQLQCYCTTRTCGAGMLDAAGAVKAALSPLPAQEVQVPELNDGTTAGGAAGGAWLLGLWMGTCALLLLRWVPKFHLKAHRRL